MALILNQTFWFKLTPFVVPLIFVMLFDVMLVNRNFYLTENQRRLLSGFMAGFSLPFVAHVGFIFIESFQ